MAERGDRVRSYQDLVVWQKAMNLAESVYSATTKFPPEERFGFTSQMRRAAVSVPTNIAEGQARQGRAEFLLFLSHARGSLAELATQTELSSRIGSLSSDTASTLLA